MVVIFVKLNKLLIGQLRNPGRITAGLIAVRGVREKDGSCIPVQHAFRRGKGALHLIIHHPVDGKGILQGSHFIVPALLEKNLRLSVDGRVEYSVQIHVHEILKIPVIAAGYGIYRFVRVGHRI